MPLRIADTELWSSSPIEQYWHGGLKKILALDPFFTDDTPPEEPQRRFVA